MDPSNYVDVKVVHDKTEEVLGFHSFETLPREDEGLDLGNKLYSVVGVVWRQGLSGYGPGLLVFSPTIYVN